LIFSNDILYTSNIACFHITNVTYACRGYWQLTYDNIFIFATNIPLNQVSHNLIFYIEFVLSLVYDLTDIFPPIIRNNLITYKYEFWPHFGKYVKIAFSIENHAGVLIRRCHSQYNNI